MESPTTTSYSVVSEFEGTLLKNPDSFSYFMLVAYEVSGLIRFTIMLFLYPVVTLLDVFGFKNAALKLMVFVATAGVRESEIELVARAVLPKFYMDDVSMDTWNVLSSRSKNKKVVVVVTRMPRLMVEMFAKEHLGADEVIGTELVVNRFGFVTGLIRESDIDQSVLNRVAKMFVDRRPPHLGLGRPAKTTSKTFLSLCEEQIHAPVNWNHRDQQQLEVQLPKPVIFYDGRFEKRPTPATALFILFWFPFGIILAAIRLFVICVLPFRALHYVVPMLGFRITVKGKPSQARNSSKLFVGNHRTIIDSVIISCALGRSIPVITLTGSGFPNIISPIPMVRISRNREKDAETIKQALSKGDVLIFPEAAVNRSQFVGRFSALFAKLTDKIVPVAMNNTVGFFHNTLRGLGPQNFVFVGMNPTIVYEVTFLDQLPIEATCASGKHAYDVANHVQRILADRLGFKSTNLTRKDMLKLVT